MITHERALFVRQCVFDYYQRLEIDCQVTSLRNNHYSYYWISIQEEKNYLRLGAEVILAETFVRIFYRPSMSRIRIYI